MTGRDVVSPRRPGRTPAAPSWRDGLNLMGWGVLLAVAGYVFVFLLPAKGTDFTDEGWYLQASMAAANGQGFDMLLPQTPFYLIGAFFIKIGLGGILDQRRLYHAIILLCMALFAWGLTNRRLGAYPTSLGLSVCLLATLTSLLSYENSPVLFALAGAGPYFVALTDREERPGTLDRLWAGALFGFATFINPTTGPSAVCIALVVIVMDRLAGVPFRRTLVLGVGMAVVFGVLFGWYFFSIGPAVFFTMPATYGIRLAKFLAVLDYTVQWPLGLGGLFGLAFIIRRLAGGNLRSGERLTDGLTWGLLAGLTLSLAAFMAARAGYGLARGLVSPLFQAASVVGLSWIARTPELLSFQLLVFFGFAFVTLALLGGVRRGAAFFRAVAATGIILLYWFNQETLTAAVVSLKTFFAGPLFFVAFFLLHRQAWHADGNRTGGRVGLVFVSALTVTACALFTSVNYSHPGHVSPLGPKVETHLPRLEGLRDTPERAELLHKLFEAYSRNDCADKILITFQKTSLLGYLFDRKLPDGLSYIWPHFRFPEDRLRQEIDSGRPWCVFVSQNGETPENWQKTEAFLRYLESRSGHVETIRATGDADPINPFVLYVGPAATP